MLPVKNFAIALFVIGLAACGGSREDNSSEDTVDLCVNSQCGEVIEIASIPDAENIHFTEQGRLFVTGGGNAHEIIQHSDDSYEAVPLTEGGCNFTGMAQKGDTMYFVCGDGQLFAGKLDDISNLQLIYQMQGMCIANGTALGPDGNLYVVDEPLNPACIVLDPKIVRLNIDPANSMAILKQETWLPSSGLGLLSLGVGDDLRFPNGLAILGSRFYSTDGGTIFYVDLLDDGTAGPVTSIFFEPTAHDDLSIAGDSLLVTDFFGGRIFQLSLDGEILQETNLLTFDSPSAVQQARPPMFRADDILVTEKGVLLEQNLPIDVLSLFRRTSE
ncbi:MAG: hypothetical protein ACSHXK_01970 [Oceanococcus sp.]